MAYPYSSPAANKADATVTATDHPAHHNALANALIDLLAELGAGPKGGSADLTARLSALDTSVSGKQASDTDLAAIAALVSAANKLPYATGSGTWSLADFTAFARTLLDDADAAAALTTLGVSAFVQTLLDDADAATARATLGAVGLTGNETVAGVKTFSSDPLIPDEAYSAVDWNGVLEPPTKNAVRDAIEALSTTYVPQDLSTLTASSAPDTDDVIPVHVDGALRKVTLADVLALASGGGFTQEEIEDFVALLIDDNSDLDWTYDDGAASLVAAIKAGAVTNSMLADADLIDLATRWAAASASGPAQLAFREDTDNGTNQAVVAAPSSMAADRALVLPDADGTLALIDTSAYGSGWNGVTKAPTADAVYDKMETLPLPAWGIELDPKATPDASSGTWVINVSNTQPTCGGLRNNPAVQNDRADFYLPPIAAGTWTFELLYYQTSSGGIVTVQLDDGAGSFTTLGTLDLYAASTTFNVRGSITGVVIASKIDKPTIRFLMATKNASSSGYQASISHLRALRTA